MKDARELMDGKFKSKERVLQSNWWIGMDQGMKEFLAKSEKCQKTKRFQHKTKNMLIQLTLCFNPIKDFKWISLVH
jgi:hypothetical protein